MEDTVFFALEADIESNGVRYHRIGVSNHFEDGHANPNPYEIANYISETLGNHKLNSGRNEVLSCTVGLIGGLKGWPENHRKTIIDAYPETGTIIFVTQYPLTKIEFQAEKRKQFSKISYS